MENDLKHTDKTFYGYCNGQTKKGYCAAFPREYADIIHLPVKKNGAIICGKNLIKDGGATILKKNIYDGKCLVVIDFDVVQGKKCNVADLPELCKYTFTVQTGSGGLHAYFWCDELIRSTVHLNVRNTNLFKGVDVRGEGGLAFAPGSKFDEHDDYYNILKDFEVKEITKKEFEELMNELLKPNILLRKGFRMILDGSIWLTHGEQAETGIPEVKYWSALFREIYSLGGDPRDFYPDLEKNQPEFDAKVSDYQWNYMLKNSRYNPDKRPSNIYYNKLFGPWDTRTLTEDEKKAKKDSKWYHDFDAYWYDMYSESIKWIHESQQWVQYSKGVFKIIPDEAVEKIIMDYFDTENIKRAPTNFNVAKRTIRANYHTSLLDYDADKNILNLKNGLLYLDTKELKPHSPAYLSMIQIPTTYKENPDPTPYWDRIKGAYPHQMDLVESFIQAIIFGDMSNEVMMFVYGPTGSGKGTMMSVIKKMFEGVCSFQPIERIGSDFGLSPLISKLINLNMEMTITDINAATMQILKSIVGRDEDLTVNIKHVREFSYKFEKMFFISATNQLPALAATDVAAWFRRVLLISFDKTQPRDYNMKDGVLLEVDDVFSYLVNKQYTPIITSGTDMSAWVNRNELEWKYSADPINHICDSLFKRTSDEFATERVDDVCNWVARRLAEEKYGAMDWRKLKSKVIDALAQRNIIMIRKDNMSQFKYIEIVDKRTNTLREEQLMEDLDGKSTDDLDTVLIGERFDKPKYNERRVYKDTDENRDRDLEEEFPE